MRFPVSPAVAESVARARAPGGPSWMWCGTRVTRTTGACKQSQVSAPSTSPTSPSPTSSRKTTLVTPAVSSSRKKKKSPESGAARIELSSRRRCSRGSPPIIAGNIGYAATIPPRVRSRSFIFDHALRLQTRDSETRDGDPESVNRGDSRVDLVATPRSSRFPSPLSQCTLKLDA